MRKNIHRNIDAVGNKLKLLSIELIILMAAFFSSVFLIVFLIKEVFIHKTDVIDQTVFLFLSRHTFDQTTVFMQGFTLLGSHYFLVPANLLLIAYSYFIRKQTWFAIKTFAVAFSSLLIMFGLKILFNRARPLSPLLHEVSGFSFPSGHAFMSFTFFGLLIYVVNRKIKNAILKTIVILVLLCIIIMVGISRIYLRVHYATDVMAGFALGIMWLIISLWALHMIEKNKTKLPPVQ